MDMLHSPLPYFFTKSVGVVMPDERHEFSTSYDPFFPQCEDADDFGLELSTLHLTPVTRRSANPGTIPSLLPDHYIHRQPLMAAAGPFQRLPSPDPQDRFLSSRLRRR